MRILVGAAVFDRLLLEPYREKLTLAVLYRWRNEMADLIESAPLIQ